MLQGGADLTGYGNSEANTLYGNGGNNVLDGGGGADTMYGGAGNDLYMVDNVGDVVVESANAGADAVFSTVNYTLSADVEALVLKGSGNINGTGNSLGNTITGNAGNNALDGMGGADTMIGGAGNDSYVVDNAGDVVVENAVEGIDAVNSSINYALAANVENLILQGTGDLQGYGNTLANTITGNAGNNLLDGGVGADTMTGGAGNDTYLVDNTGDTVSENPSGGNDAVFSLVNYMLPANVETLVLQGGSDLTGYGSGSDNTLKGNSGNNYLDGGAGADLMMGGTGNDLYVVDNVGDMVVENANEGADVVFSTVNYTLSAEVEALVLQGSGNVNGAGNSLANTITGNAGNNTLDGMGGADTMIGGAGNDIYVVDNAGDVVAENAGGGTDTINAGFSYSLAGLANVENLTLTGAGNFIGTGNGGNNTITGNAGDNTLDGGAGADTMLGGVGNDSYFVDNAGDVVTENVNEGSDTVYAID